MSSFFTRVVALRAVEKAIAVLGVWPKPSVLDRVDGTPLGTMERDSAADSLCLGSGRQDVLHETPCRLAGSHRSQHLVLAGVGLAHQPAIGELRRRRGAKDGFRWRRRRRRHL